MRSAHLDLGHAQGPVTPWESSQESAEILALTEINAGVQGPRAPHVYTVHVPTSYWYQTLASNQYKPVGFPTLRVLKHNGGPLGFAGISEWKSEKWAHSLKRGFLYPCNKEEIPLGREKRGHWKIRHLSGHTEFAFHYVNTTKTKQTRTSPETTLLSQPQIYVFPSFSLLFTALQGLHWNL